MAGGRPRGVKNSKPPVKKEKITYICATCGREQPDKQFYINRASDLWDGLGREKHIPYCRECMDKKLELYNQKFGSYKKALLLCCYIMDFPYDAVLYESLVKNNAIFTLGLYLKNMGLAQYRNKTFMTTLMSDELFAPQEEFKEIIESKWSKSDKQNKNFCLSVIGYDPFENCGMTDNDRKHCFNILAGYCDCDGIQEDGHKLQSVIEMTQSLLQVSKINEISNEELLRTDTDDARVKNLTATKKQLMDSIAKIAQDNNISSAYNASSKQGANTLSFKQKELAQNDYEAIKVNLFNIKTAEAMKQIADLSNRSILEQIGLETNDYVDIVKDQRETIIKLEDNKEALEEENRLLKNQIINLTTKKK